MHWKGAVLCRILLEIKRINHFQSTYFHFIGTTLDFVTQLFAFVPSKIFSRSCQIPWYQTTKSKPPSIQFFNSWKHTTTQELRVVIPGETFPCTVPPLGSTKFEKWCHFVTSNGKRRSPCNSENSPPSPLCLFYHPSVLRRYKRWLQSAPIPQS